MLKLRQVGPNQNILILNNTVEILFSYETPVVIDTGEEVLVTNKKFSTTTSRHINQYVGDRESRKVAQIEIENFLT